MLICSCALAGSKACEKCNRRNEEVDNEKGHGIKGSAGTSGCFAPVDINIMADPLFKPPTLPAGAQITDIDWWTKQQDGGYAMTIKYVLPHNKAPDRE